MYCNKCGKELPAESLFCPYCGEKQAFLGNDNTFTIGSNKGESIQSTQTNDKTKANSVADEIIANLKMVGLAILLCTLYLGVFRICHINDTKHITSFSGYGTSCYDEVDMRYYETDWGKIYNKIKCKKDEQILQRQIQDQQWAKSSPEMRKKLEAIRDGAPGSELINVSDEELIRDAKKKASENLEYMISLVNDRRDSRFRDDFINHLKYSILVSLALTIFGRYLIKGIKWVAANKT